MTNSPLAEQRAFYLTLDPTHGQKVAKEAGFIPPSEEVMQREYWDVKKAWAFGDAMGYLPMIHQYAKWYTDVSMPEHATDSERMMGTNALTVFAFAALSRLRKNGILVSPREDQMHIVVKDENGNVINHDIPEELLEYAAEFEEYLLSGGIEDE